jgi:hypothetical protein
MSLNAYSVGTDRAETLRLSRLFLKLENRFSRSSARFRQARTVLELQP